MEDYIGGFFSLPLSRGTSQGCLSISIINDSTLEDQIETFLVLLSNVDPGVNNSAAIATVQIFDDDGKLGSYCIARRNLIWQLSRLHVHSKVMVIIK